MKSFLFLSAILLVLLPLSEALALSKGQIDSLQKCKIDDDCVYVMGSCGVRTPMNKKHAQVAEAYYKATNKRNHCDQTVIGDFSESYVGKPICHPKKKICDYE